jgi:hypothetical protein
MLVTDTIVSVCVVVLIEMKVFEWNPETSFAALSVALRSASVFREIVTLGFLPQDPIAARPWLSSSSTGRTLLDYALCTNGTDSYVIPILLGLGLDPPCVTGWEHYWVQFKIFWALATTERRAEAERAQATSSDRSLATQWCQLL